MTLPRKLAFPDRWVEKLVQEIGLPCDGESIVFPDKTTPIKFIVELSENEFTKIYSALLTGADLSYPDEAHEITWLLLKQLECPVSICDELLECFQPLFDGLTEQIEGVSEQVQQLQEQFDESQQVQPPEPFEADTCSEGAMYNAALQAVDQVELLINGIYKRAEVEAPDNLAEATEMLLSAIPLFETLPMDELFSLTQWVFDNQRAMFEAAMVEEIEGHYWFEHAAAALWCLVKDDCIINHEKIGMWLSSLDDAFPDNYAAEIFAKFGDATEPSMTNQIGMLLNSLRGGQSLAEFFDDIIVQFGVGAQGTNPDYLWIECPVLCEFEPLAADDPSVSPFGQDSGIAVTSGTIYTITAGGMWDGGAGSWSAEGDPGAFNPSAVLPSARLYSILVKVGDGGTWYGGDEVFNYTAPATGTLYFAMNDVPGAYTDNSGSLCVTVEIAP